MMRRAAALAFLAAALWACSPGRTYRDVVQKISEIPVGEITRETSVVQTFVSNHDRLSGIALQMATWARTNTCDVAIHVRREGSDADLVTQRLKCAEIMDNVWLAVDFAPAKDSLDKRFVILVDSPNGTRGNAVTVWMASRRVYPDGQLSLNGKAVPGALTFMSFHR